MRKVRRSRRKKQRKILIIGTLSFLLFLCGGYAAFNTSLSLNAKGNIKQLNGAKMLRKECNTENGDGLYKDIYEEGKCTYKGANPNNYIKFNNEIWRIVSINSDETIKIVKNDVIKGDFLFTDIANKLNDYLQSIEKSKIIKNKFKDSKKIQNAQIEFNLDLNTLIYEENKRMIDSEIGTITMGEYLRANSNIIECGTDKLMIDNESICTTTNWMNFLNNSWWWLNYFSTNKQCIHYVVGAGCVQYFDEYYALANIRPVLYLAPNITLSGTGSEIDPYIITN